MCKFIIRHRVPIVLILRTLVGAVFIMSGLTKMLDPWGFIFKIEEYFTAWGWDIPRTVDLMCALSLSAYEFILGILLLLGCYRRVAPLLLTLCMAFMLPLTLYIWIKNPVADCGCFGEFWILGNGTTFWKNVVITALLIVLIINNRRVRGLFRHNLQWVVMFASAFYILTIGLVSYAVQPLADFHHYPVGSSLINETTDETDDEMSFIYEKDGLQHTFTVDNLPDEDDGWIYIDRFESPTDVKSALTIFDPSTGDDITESVITPDEPILILVMSEPARADLSDTYAINELNDAITSSGGQMIALLATGAKGIERWRDLSMGTYECFIADDTQLKELVRGVMSLVYLEEGKIMWKRTISSIDLEDINAIAAGNKSISSLNFNGGRMLLILTIILVSFIIILFLVQQHVIALRRHHSKIAHIKLRKVKNLH